MSVTSPNLFVNQFDVADQQQQQDDDIITINVGGTVFQALRETLSRYECYFSAHFRFHESQQHQYSQQQLHFHHQQQQSNNLLNVFSGGGSLSVSPLSGVTSPIGSINGATISDAFYSNPSMIFNEPLIINQQRKKNNIFIDRNPELFKYVLDCMRMLDKNEMKQCLPTNDLNLLQRLSIEASYFSFMEMSEAIQFLLTRKKKFASVSVGFDKFKLVSFVNCEGLNSKTSNQLSAPNTISEVFQVLNDNGCTVEHIISRKAIEGFESRIFPKEEHNKALVTIIASYYESM